MVYPGVAWAIRGSREVPEHSSRGVGAARHGFHAHAIAAGWVCLLLVVALATYALQAGASKVMTPSSLTAYDAAGARWMASLAGPNAAGTVVGASGAVGYATPPPRNSSHSLHS
jgi:hypothetical protein